MDREQFREQITQRYVAGKALEGASLEEISSGIVDPVEQMNYVTGQTKQNSTSPSSQSGSAIGWLIFISLIALAVLSGLFKILL
ncbi:MAG: hypothetical protein K2W95_32465 [Candidatus Obscuribacterales bacterium]|nr:hypothetical protein [Candidatus Obscuribacterales bacterium]